MPGLLTVSGDRIPLELGRTYVLGRGRDCDIVVADMSCSRKHARIEVGALPELVSIVDLVSSNGTYVDERRVEGRKALAHGSRIQLGTTLYLLSTAGEHEESSSDLFDTGTVAVEQLSLGAGVDKKVLQVLRASERHGAHLAGQIGSFSVVEVLQMLMQAGRSGTLHIVVESGHATVDVRRGEVHGASFDEQEGFDALVVMARQERGMFWLEEGSQPCRRNVNEPASRLLVDLCCAIDEHAAR